MKIAMDGKDLYAENRDEFLQKLMAAIESQNEIWLSDDNEKNPALCILIAGSYFTMTFFPFDGHPGMNSVSVERDSTQSKDMIFSMHGEECEIIGKYVVDRDTCLKTALSFFDGARPPTEVGWEEL